MSPYRPVPAATAASTTVTPISGHPPVTTSGVVAKFDSTNGVMVFQDGRTVRLTDQSQLVDAKTTTVQGAVSSACGL